MWRLIILVIGTASLAAVPGCGPAGASVTGTVTLDGTPLSTGLVVFHSTTDSATNAFGTIRFDGGYDLPTNGRAALPLGAYIATVEASTPPTVGPGGKEVAGTLLTPARYQLKDHSPLQFELKAGTNRIDLALQSK